MGMEKVKTKVQNACPPNNCPSVLGRRDRAKAKSLHFKLSFWFLIFGF